MVTLSQIPPAIRSQIAKLYADHQRVDLSIDSILEGQRGGNIQIIVDDPIDPKVVQIVQASFTSFAGDATSSSAQELVTNLPERCWVQPCPAEWMDLLRRVHGDKLVSSPRYSFLSDSIRPQVLVEIINASAYKSSLERIDLETAREMLMDNLNKYHFMNYVSPEDFIALSFGYCVKVDGQVVAACSAGLVCSKGVEICIITQPEYREQGLATLVAAKFILHCLENNLEPHWDAANPKSVGLAQKLGYKYSDSYEVVALLQS